MGKKKNKQHQKAKLLYASLMVQPPIVTTEPIALPFNVFSQHMLRVHPSQAYAADSASAGTRPLPPTEDGPAVGLCAQDGQLDLDATTTFRTSESLPSCCCASLLIVTIHVAENFSYPNHVKGVRNSEITSFFPVLNTTNEVLVEPNIPDTPAGSKTAAGGETAGARGPRIASQSGATPKTLSDTAEDQAKSEAAKGLKELLEHRAWLIQKKLLDAEDNCPSQLTIAKILCTTAKAVGAFLKRRAELEEMEVEEEGEIEESGMVKDMKEEILSTMKSALQEAESRMQAREECMQDRVDRSIKTLEEIANEVKGRGEARASYKDATASQLEGESFPPLGSKQGPTTKLAAKANWNEAREREHRRAKARQLVLDVDKEHLLANTSNVGRREEI
ncbi:hypothetical protein P691DRAFT_782620 [Macrolepiota fuliginosa MF-IS2]|uniref:Uncharacterized protein n=1 Tax=Macrolepiota fuliginosa MF-IS2 TaxID=1400762 RepID=A0A9P6BV53_9AGAR|nr:hypothetical protein P691DRAFT_782620 [Macrolepiota fuliginosa MF-IS2]